MPAPREPARQEAITRDSRRRQVARLHASGSTPAEMVKALTDAGARRISLSTINRDLLALKKQWRDDNAAAGEQYFEHVRRLDAEIEYWRRQVLMAPNTPEGIERAITIYASIVLPLLKERAKLLGLYPPKRVEVSSFVRNWAMERGLDPDRAVELARQVVDSTGF